jgi:membrane protease YdiL (CAAX protease family)
MEELVFRGYLFRIIRENLGGGRTIFLTALAFSVVHVTNPGASFLAWINILLIGVVLGQLRALSGGLAMPFGLHLGWNLALGMLFGVPVSGLVLPSAFRISLEDVSPALGGGGFGPEASMPLTVLLIVVVVLLARRLAPPGEETAP